MLNGNHSKENKGMVVWQVVTLVLAVAVLAFIGYLLFFHGGDFNKFALELSCRSKKNFYCDVLKKTLDQFYAENEQCRYLTPEKLGACST